MSEQILYPQVQILHRCIVSSLWPEPTERGENHLIDLLEELGTEPELEFIF
jgi:hypothetical protein